MKDIIAAATFMLAMPALAMVQQCVQNGMYKLRTDSEPERSRSPTTMLIWLSQL